MNQTNIPTSLWIIGGVSFYIAVMLSVGFWASRRVKDTKDYVVAGGHMGWWLSFGTIFATWFGAETCMGSSSTAFEKGILGVIADPFGAGFCLVISGIFFAKFFKGLGIKTIVDFFEIRYGRKAASGFSLIYLPVYLGWIGAQLLAFGIILNSLTGLPILPSVLISTAVVLIYTYSGGMWADAATDLFQMIILVAGLLILFPVLLADMGGFAKAKAVVPPEFFYFYPRNPSPLTWLNYLQAWMIVGLGSLPAQDLFQRTMAPKTPSMARWASISAGIFYVMIGMLPVLLGIIGRAALPENTGGSILIDLALKYLPAPLIALMVGALLSAIMSSADSALLAPASIVGNNIVPYLKPDADDRLKLSWCRLSVPLIGILSLILALYFKNIYRLCQEAWGVLLVGLAAPMIAGVYWKRANTKGAVAGALAGITSWISFKIFLPENYPHNLMGFLASSLALIVISWTTQKKEGAHGSFQKKTEIKQTEEALVSC